MTPLSGIERIFSIQAHAVEECLVLDKPWILMHPPTCVAHLSTLKVQLRTGVPLNPW